MDFDQSIPPYTSKVPELFVINKFKNFLPVESLKTLYFALINPFPSYGITVWGNESQSYLRRTSNLQKKNER